MLLGPIDGLLGPAVGTEAARMRGAIPVLAGLWDTRTKVQAIADLRPGVVAGAASYIVHLTEVAGEMGVDLSQCGLRSVTSFGEPGAAIAATQERIRRSFGVDHAMRSISTDPLDQRRDPRQSLDAAVDVIRVQEA